MLSRQLSGAESSIHLASPVLGTGVPIDLLEGLALTAWQQGAGDPALFAWEAIASRGQRLAIDGTPLETEAENLAEIRRHIDDFAAGRLLVLSQLGVVV